MQYQCGLCDYVYDERQGDPLQGIPPGTPWTELPDGWCCPECGLSGTEFHVHLSADERRGGFDYPHLHQEAKMGADTTP
jgi:rubredoxin